jgi:spore maturation protein CgeB
LADSAIALNLLRQQNLPDGVNMRTFEVPGCGGFALATRTKGALAILPEDSASVYFDDLEECCMKIERFLAKPVERVELTESAHARVTDGHQYAHRARRILDVFHSA